MLVGSLKLLDAERHEKALGKEEKTRVRDVSMPEQASWGREASRCRAL